jgi:hypothetical protein
MSGRVRTALMCACIIMLLSASLLPAITRSELEGIVDFSVTLKSVAAAAKGGPALPAEKYFILVGTVTEVVFINKDPEAFSVRVQLLSGEWVGLDDVKGYTCYVTFTGSRFSSLFPARATEDSPANIIVVNTRVLVIVRSSGTMLSPSGEKTALLEGVEVRAIQ